MGFKERCLAYYDAHENKLNLCASPYPYDNCPIHLRAPLWQQAFDWFREKHNYNAEITWNNTYKAYTALCYPTDILKGGEVLLCGNFKKQEYKLARQACLEKLIELIQ